MSGLRAGDALTGATIGVDAAGRPLLHTPAGTFAVATQVKLTMGAAVALEVTQVGATAQAVVTIVDGAPQPSRPKAELTLVSLPAPGGAAGSGPEVIAGAVLQAVVLAAAPAPQDPERAAPAQLATGQRIEIRVAGVSAPPQPAAASSGGTPAEPAAAAFRITGIVTAAPGRGTVVIRTEGASAGVNTATSTAPAAGVVPAGSTSAPAAVSMTTGAAGDEAIARPGISIRPASSMGAGTVATMRTSSAVPPGSGAGVEPASAAGGADVADRYAPTVAADSEPSGRPRAASGGATAASSATTVSVVSSGGAPVTASAPCGDFRRYAGDGDARDPAGGHPRRTRNRAPGAARGSVTHSSR